MKQQTRNWVVFGAAIATLSLGAGAQNVPSEFVVSGEAAEKILDSTTINLSTAERIVRECQRLAEEEGVQVSIFVLDNDGNYVYMSRMDGQNRINIITAEMKARTALAVRAPSKSIMNLVARNPVEELQQMELGLFANSGGLPIIVNDQLIGAVGAGGSAPRVGEGWSDEICLHKAMTEVLGPQPPLLEDLPRNRGEPGSASVPVPRLPPASLPPASALPPEFVVSGAAAARIRDGNQISADAAGRVAMACREWAARRGGNASLVILDTANLLVHVERMDGQTGMDIGAALTRAQTALRNRGNTSSREATVTNNPGSLARYLLEFDSYADSGGLPIIVDNQIIGAIGIAGSDHDEACAVAGLQAVFGDRVAVPAYPETN